MTKLCFVKCLLTVKTVVLYVVHHNQSAVQCLRVTVERVHPGLVLICPHTSHCLIWCVRVCVCVLKPEPSPASCSPSHGHKVPAGQKSCRRTSSRSFRRKQGHESLWRLLTSFWGPPGLQQDPLSWWSCGRDDGGLKDFLLKPTDRLGGSSAENPRVIFKPAGPFLAPLLSLQDRTPLQTFSRELI